MRPIASDGCDHEDYYFNPDTVVNRFVKISENTYFGGDSFAVIMPYFGSTGHSAYLGCKHKCLKDTMWINPCLVDWDAEKLHFHQGIVNRDNQIIERIAKQFGGRYICSMSDNCSFVDAVVPQAFDLIAMIFFYVRNYLSFLHRHKQSRELTLACSRFCFTYIWLILLEPVFKKRQGNRG